MTEAPAAGDAGTLWIDVDELFHYAASGLRRPSGVQRVVFELCRALQARCGENERLGFVRHNWLRKSVSVVAWNDVAALFQVLTSAPGAASRPARRGAPGDSAARRTLKRLSFYLPERSRRPLIRLARAQLESLRAVAAFGRGIGKRRDSAVVPGGRDFAQVVRPGDIFLTLGATWTYPDYPGLLRILQQRHGIRTALLLYDIVPLRHPEWFDLGYVCAFRAWLEGVLPLCATLMAVSRASANDVQTYAERHGLPLKGPVHVVPLGSGFGKASSGLAAPATRPLPPPGTYALFVSTIEARKNHALLVGVWQRLLDDMPTEAVPTLVFAGRVGWMVGDLMQQLDTTGWLDGRIVLVEDPSDAELAALYRGCLFTLFPSLYEGWGLPVTESLAFGKPCIASNATAVPEAGGMLARYFDPENVAEATDVIRATIEDRAGLAAWEGQVRREFRPVPWAAAADALIATLRQDTATAS
jgi:glycosyltransferase involved in cell wall biosynthesis